MPAGTEHDANLLILLLYQWLHIGMVRHAFGVGVFREGTEAAAEGFLIGVCDRLIAEVDHFVAEEGGADFRELFVGESREVDAADLCAHRGGERTHVDVLVGGGAVVELASGMDEHGLPLRSHSTSLWSNQSRSQTMAYRICERWAQPLEKPQA